MYKNTLKIDGMVCGMCEAHVNDVIRRQIKDVQKLSSSYRKGLTSFISVDRPDEESLHKALADSGYELADYKSEVYEKKAGFFR